MKRQESAVGVRREKAVLSQWVQVPPGSRSNRKQPERLAAVHESAPDPDRKSPSLTIWLCHVALSRPE